MAKQLLAQVLDVAVQHHLAGRLSEAQRLYHQILAGNPNHAHTLNLFGVLANDVGRSDVAVDLIGRAVQNAPNVADYHNNLGEAMRRLGRRDEAASCFRRAIQLRADYGEAHSNLGIVLMDQGRFAEAILHYQRAVEFNPALAEAYNNLAIALDAMGRLDDSIECYRRMLALKSDRVEPHRTHSSLIMALHYHPRLDSAAIFKETEHWNRLYAAPFARQAKSHENDRSAERRLRIGYVSADFRDHACAHFLHPLLRCHDHSRFSVFCYAHVAQPDALSEQFQSMADVWREIAGMSDDEVADQVRRDDIDILVDLGSHTDQNRLLVFARKPAPVQATWLSCPGTTGLDAINYRFTDPHLDPSPCPQDIYSEESICLPDTYWCYDPLTAEPAVNALPALTSGHITFGSLNKVSKLNDAFLGVCGAVLRAVTGSRLLLLVPEGDARQRVLTLLQNDGVEPDRVDFVGRLPHEQYLSVYHRIDIGLDTFPYTGHTTSLDSFWMGVPVITSVGRTVVGRIGASQLMNLRLPELIAHTIESTAPIATRLASDLPRLQELRSTLRDRMQKSPLMDAPSFTRNMEGAYRQMWKNWCVT